MKMTYEENANMNKKTNICLKRSQIEILELNNTIIKFKNS